MAKKEKLNKIEKTAQLAVYTSQVEWVAFARGVAHRGMVWVLIVYGMSIIVTPCPLFAKWNVTLCAPQLPG